MQDFRLDKGGRIDRSRELSFRFDGKRYKGYQAIRSPRRCSRMV